MGSKLETSIAILNGAIGDYLARTGNGLATETTLLTSPRDGTLLPTGPLPGDLRPFGGGPARLVILVHGLMCTESLWLYPGGGSDYGSLLTRDLGLFPLYVRYNSGLPIAESGQKLDAVLVRLVETYGPQIADISFVAHSMGGLVVRSACHAAALAGHAWLGLTRKAVYLGTPHLGAPLERIGRVAAKILRAVPDPYTRLVAEIGDMRSRGIKDLGDGLRDKKHPVPLLREMQHYLVAGSLSAEPWIVALFGDAIVPTSSAMNGIGAEASAALPPGHVRIFHGSNHMMLARDPSVYAFIRDFLAGDPGRESAR